MQWQHGTFEKASDGKLHLTPFGDGRQLLSDPCNNDAGVYTKYDQNETFKVRADIHVAAGFLAHGQKLTFAAAIRSRDRLLPQHQTIEPLAV